MPPPTRWIKNITANNLTIHYHDNGNVIKKELFSQDVIQLTLDQCDEIQLAIGDCVICVSEEALV